MSFVAEPNAFAGIRAPRDNKTALIEPPLALAGDLLLRNRQQRMATDADFCGRSWSEMALTARQELIAAAWRYTRQYRDVARPPRDRSDFQSDDKTILSGHQPELFHPGVWFKNFVLDRLARDEGAWGIHLLIDNDVLDSSHVTALTGDLGQPRRCAIPLDAHTVPLPYEERWVRDPRTFEQFGARLAEAIGPWVPAPLIRRLWPEAVAARKRTPNLGQCLAQARHRLEAEWGLNTLELPLSVVCETDGFRRFAAHIFATLPEFRAVYNQAVLEYRQRHRLRSESHPAPLLGAEAGWLEAPFWGWSQEDPQRRAVLVRRVRNGWQLRLSGARQLPAVTGRESAGGEIGTRLSQAGIKLRPRALMTTMYARLCLSDLFLHGIGGAKYDEVTDVMIQRLFRLPPPAYLAVSATVRLPLDYPSVLIDDVRRQDVILRELWYHPERFPLGPSADAAVRDAFLHWCQRKARHLAVRPSSGSRQSWQRELEAIQHALRQMVAPQRLACLKQRVELADLARSSALLSSREYSFCLFPDNDLRQTLLYLSGLAPYATVGTEEKSLGGAGRGGNLPR